MLDEEFLAATLAKEDVKAEDKIKLILAEAGADSNARVEKLEKKRDELLGEIVSLKASVKSGEASVKELTEKNAALVKELAEKNPEELARKLEEQYRSDADKQRKQYEDAAAVKDAEYRKQLDGLTAERDQYKASHLKRLLGDAIGEGTKGFSFRDEFAKDGFVARVLSLNEFEPAEVNGETKFLNRDRKEPKDVFLAFSLTPEGKSYLKNPTSGGGASGSSGGTPAGGSMSREQFDQMSGQQQREFFNNGGTLV